MVDVATTTKRAPSSYGVYVSVTPLTTALPSLSVAG